MKSYNIYYPVYESEVMQNLPASVVNEEVVTAFNLLSRSRDRPMRVTDIIRYVPTENDRNARYRLHGVDVETGDIMNKFCNEMYAEQVSNQLNVPIRDFEHLQP